MTPVPMLLSSRDPCQSEATAQHLWLVSLLISGACCILPSRFLMKFTARTGLSSIPREDEVQVLHS